MLLVPMGWTAGAFTPVALFASECLLIDEVGTPLLTSSAVISLETSSGSSGIALVVGGPSSAIPDVPTAPAIDLSTVVLVKDESKWLGLVTEPSELTLVWQQTNVHGAMCLTLSTRGFTMPVAPRLGGAGFWIGVLVALLDTWHSCLDRNSAYCSSRSTARIICPNEVDEPDGMVDAVVARESSLSFPLAESNHLEIVENALCGLV